MQRRNVDFSGKLNSALCPIKINNRHFKMANINETCDKYIFRGLCKTKRELTLEDNQHQCQGKFFQGLKSIGVKTKLIGLHSFRYAASTNFGVEDILFEKHDRWKCEKIKDGYVIKAS